MVEVSPEELLIMTNFIKETVPQNFAIDEAPDNVKNEYAQALQVANQFGPEEQSAQPEMAAPG